MVGQPDPARSSDFLASLLEASPFAVICLDPQGRVRFWNDTAESIFGYRAAEVLGQPLPIVPRGGEDEYARLFERVMAGHKWHRLRLRRRRKDGTLVDVSASGAPVYDKSGDIQGVVYTAEDITDQVKLEDSLRQAQKMEAVGQLTGGVAHDFNNLLGIITMNAELLADRVRGDDEARDLIEAVRTAADRGADLTHQLLAFSRRQPLHPREVDLNEVVAHVGRMVRRTLGENIDVRTATAEGLWTAHVDAAQLENAILNLAINARDAMPDGGRLLIGTANAELGPEDMTAGAEGAPGAYVMVSVTDTGTGIAPELVDRVFEPFFTTKSEGEGTGLGLSMVYGFVKQSRGHVRIDSATGRGTSVKVYLPRALNETDLAASEAAEVPEARGGERILVVEDDPAVRRGAVKLLKGLGYRTLEAATAPEALEILEGESGIELVFTDVVMPGGMSGLELAHEIRQRWPGTGVLCTSGYSETFVRANESNAGGPQFLMKPYRKHELARAVKTALGT